MHAPLALTCSNAFEVTVNGARRRVENVPPETTLLQWLRDNRLTGTKEGCAEGDCGACTVALVDSDANGRATYRAINSCIAPIAGFADREIVTVEGLAKGGELHPAQACMVKHFGSQCGYCTPGFVMSLFEGCHRTGMADPTKIADQLAGNLCRCTGYRPIRDAAMELYSAPVNDGFEPVWTAPNPGGYEADERRYLRPATLSGLFEMRRSHPDAVLVAGATEIGVDITKRACTFPVLLALDGIEELRRCERTETHWTFGATATLTQIEEFLNGESAILSHLLSVFASRQIRNRATLGGNLVTASPIGDSAPVLLALGASIVLASPGGERRLPLEEFFIGYRKTALRVDEVLKAVIVPRPPAGRRERFFKVSKRREMDISIVAAAFCIDLDKDGVVTAARFGFGGLAATPVLATEAAGELIGHSMTEDRIDAVARKLERTFSPISDARGTAEYRAGLAAALWRKFASGDSSEAQDLVLTFEGGERWEIADPSRAQAHESAVAHVTGRAQYVEDLALRRGGMLTMWPVGSPHAHAKILRVDTSAAERMPGVVCVLTSRDVPGINDIGCSRPDESLFAEDEAMFCGHMVAVVVAESEATARAAAAKVEVEYEPLEAILSISEAIAKDSFHTEPNFIRRGDVAAGLQAAPRRLHGTFELGGQEHFYLETHAAWAEVMPDEGVYVCSSTQHPTEIQIIVARVLGLQRNEVVVEALRMGGGFGGKETQGNTWAALAAVAAWKTGTAVRVQLDRDVDMQLTGKRHPFFATFDVGFDDNGHLLAAKVDLVSNGGWSLDLSMPITDRALFHLDNAYYIPAVEFSGRVAKTHLVSNTAFRGFGGPQGMLVIEEIIDRIARSLGLPPEIVRERNLYHGRGETNTTHYGQEIGDNRIEVLWREALADSKFAERRGEIEQWNAGHAMVKRGLAITPVKFGISFTFTPYNQAGALVLAYADGTLQVNHGGTEMGQGLHTKILGVVMRELGLPAESVRLMSTRTDKVPNTSATAASSSADLNGAAVADACRKLRKRMHAVAAATLDAPPDAEMVMENGRIWFSSNPEKTITFAELCGRMHLLREPLFAAGFYRTPGIHWDRVAGKGRPFYYFACGAAVTEVEVDGWTGMHRVRRVDIVHDVGESLNPGIDRGQIEGGFVQGMGWLTREELLWSEAGRLLTHSASTYQIPAFSDAPADFRVRMLRQAAQEGTIHGSKAVGEPPLMLAISVREAIRDAIAAFGPRGGAVELASPATSEAIFHAIRRRLRE